MAYQYNPFNAALGHKPCSPYPISNCTDKSNGVMSRLTMTRDRHMGCQGHGAHTGLGSPPGDWMCEIHAGSGCYWLILSNDSIVGLQTGEGLLTKQCRCSLRAQKSPKAGLGYSRWWITRGTCLFYKHTAQVIPCWPFPEVPSWLAGWLALALSGPNHFSSQNDQTVQLR